MRLKELNQLQAAKGVHVGSRIRAAVTMEELQRDGRVALIYNDSHYKFILRICKELNINVELWGRHFLCTDRQGNIQPYFTVWLIIPEKTGKYWEFFKNTNELQEIDV
jgi:hypothetical protein